MNQKLFTSKKNMVVHYYDEILLLDQAAGALRDKRDELIKSFAEFFPYKPLEVFYIKQHVVKFHLIESVEMDASGTLTFRIRVFLQSGNYRGWSDNTSSMYVDWYDVQKSKMIEPLPESVKGKEL